MFWTICCIPYAASEIESSHDSIAGRPSLHASTKVEKPSHVWRSTHGPPARRWLSSILTTIFFVVALMSVPSVLDMLVEFAALDSAAQKRLVSLP